MDLKAVNDLLSYLQRPTRYLGREINARYKDPRAVGLRVALVFPDLYEVGMSHLGLAILYDLLNQQDDIWAERVYAPAPDLEAELRNRRRPLTSLESGTPVKDFDLVGISLQYELGYTNLLNILDLGGIPLLAAERGPHDPVVIGGGPAAFNPEPVAPFFDAFVLGDGEEVVLELAALIKDWKATAGTRQELWQTLEEVPGVYVPALFDMVFDDSGILREIIPRGRRSVVHKRLLRRLDQVSLSPLALVPFCRTVHDRLNVELSRGCTRGCRYCQAGIIYRPVRERQPEALEEWVAAALAATGYEELSLLSLSPGDYRALPGLLHRLMDRLAPQRVALSLPSLRADTLNPEMVSQIQRVRRTGLTIAPEAGSERLRRLINKNLPEEAIINAVQQVCAHGWRLLKLYFMLGLPGETPADRQAIPRLVRRLQDCAPPGRVLQLHVSLSTFIPKPHTPFQWEAQSPLEDSREYLHAVKDRLKGKHLQLKWNSVAQSWLEGIFSRGDRRLAPVLVHAYHRGCRLDAWSEHLRLSLWRQVFQETGVDPESYLRARHLEEVLPWQHLNTGVSREFLLAERERAYQGVETPDCRLTGCHHCGVCHHQAMLPQALDNSHPTGETITTPPTLLPPAGTPPHSPYLSTGAPPTLLNFSSPSSSPLQQNPTVSPPSPAFSTQPVSLQAPSSHLSSTWYRLTFAKLEEMRWLSHLELISTWYRSLRRSCLPLTFTAGHHPVPRVVFHGALPVGMESQAETLDLELAQPLASEVVREKLNQVLPPGLRVLYVQRCPRQWKPPAVSRVVYEVWSPEPVFLPEAAARFLSQGEIMVTRQRPREVKSINVRPLVVGLSLKDRQHLTITLRVEEKDNVKVAEILAAIFGLSPTQTATLRIRKTTTISFEP